jgi:hypothetical protein
MPLSAMGPLPSTGRLGPHPPIRARNRSRAPETAEADPPLLIAARRGSAAAIELFEKHRNPINLSRIDAPITACARNQTEASNR